MVSTAVSAITSLTTMPCIVMMVSGAQMRATCVRHAFWAVAVKTGDGGEMRVYDKHLRMYARC